MSTFAHGSRAGLMYDGRDMTRFTKDFNFAVDIDLNDQTCLQAPAGAKESLYGNNGATLAINAQLAKSRTIVERELEAVLGNEADEDRNRLFLFAPFGYTLGRSAFLGSAKKSSFGVNGGTTSLVTTSGNIVANTRRRLGRLLQVPRVQGATFSQNEIQRLNWVSVDPNQFIGFRANGSSIVSTDLQLSSFITANVLNVTTLCAAIKSRVEALAAYTGRTVTVTVLTAFTVTGGLWSGVVQLSFNGTVDLPLVESVAGGVQNLGITGGDTGNYSFNAAAPLTLPVTEAQMQANQQALVGQYSNVVVKGSSSANTAQIVHTVAATNSTANAVIYTNITITPAMTAAALQTLIQAKGGVYANAIVTRSAFTLALSGTQGGELDGTYTDNGTLNNSKPVFIGTAAQPLRSDVSLGNWNLSNAGSTINYGQIGTQPWPWSAGNYSRNGGAFTFVILAPFSVTYTITFPIGTTVGDVATVPGAGWTGSSSNPGPNGAMSMKAYFPVAATPAAPSKTGTGATATTAITGGNLATTITGVTYQDGGVFEGLNVVSGNYVGTSVQTSISATTLGATIDLHADYVSPGVVSITPTVKHSPDGTNWTTLATFTTITDATNRDQCCQRIVLPNGTTVQPYLRLDVPNMIGSTAIGCALSRRAA